MAKQKHIPSEHSTDKKPKKSNSKKFKKNKKSTKSGNPSKSRITIDDHLDIIKKSYVASPDEDNADVMEVESDKDIPKSDEEVAVESDEESVKVNKKTNGKKIQREEKYSAFAGNLTQSVSDAVLLDLILTVISKEELKELKIARKPDGSSKGYAYLELNSEEALDKVLTLNGEKLKNQRVLFGKNDKVLERILVDVKNTLYITRIRAELTDGQILKFLEEVIPLDEIVRFDRIKTIKAVPTGSLILEVDSEEALEQVKKLDGTELGNKAISVEMFRTYLRNPCFISKQQEQQEKWKKNNAKKNKERFINKGKNKSDN